MKIRLPDVEERKTFYRKDGSNENWNSIVRKLLRMQNLKFVFRRKNVKISGGEIKFTMTQIERDKEYFLKKERKLELKL